MGVSGREREREGEGEGEREWRPAMTHVEGGEESPRGREMRVSGRAVSKRERGGASSPSYSGPDLWGGAYLAIAR